MAMLRVLNDFLGTWHLDRVIRDPDGRDIGHFTGIARITGDDKEAGYCETGTLAIPHQPAMQAERRYLWRAEAGLIAVLFDDGRPFHRFDPRAGQPEARHFCDPDTYVVRYDLRNFPAWGSSWTVSGPRKAYVMQNSYVRE